MAYLTWLDSYQRDAAASNTGPFARIVLALTSNGSLYAGFPVAGEGYRIRRFSPADSRAQQDIAMEGMMAAVEPLVPGTDRPLAEEIVSCDGREFRVVPGCFGRPVVGKSMMVGRTDNRHEVTSPVRWVRALDLDRASFVDLVFDAYRHRDPIWLDYVDQATRRVRPVEAAGQREAA